MGYIKMLICNLFETKKTISSSKNTYFHVDRQKKEEKHCKCNLYSLNLKQTLSMIRFILHSILILVVTQLSNVAMGLIMTESQHTAVTYQLAQLHDSINKGQNLDFQNQYPSPLIRGDVNTQELKRGLYEIIVYNSTLADGDSGNQGSRRVPKRRFPVLGCNLS